MDLDAFRSYLAFRFKTPVHRAFFAKTASKDPIAISRVQAGPCRTRLMAPEPGFAVHIYLSPLARLDGWIDGHHTRFPPLNTGDVTLMDLQASPIAQFHQPADFVRVQISRRTLHDLAYDFGQRPPDGLRTILGGVHDPILLRLSRALAAKADDFDFDDPLFGDHVALAFHAQIVRAYADGWAPTQSAGGLAPWQSRRACDMMTSNLQGDLTLADIAQACGVSVSYFLRAFRRTMGAPPHKWLMNERVRRAKELLCWSKLSLSEVALACGFSDQSHLTRAFRRAIGQTPGQWKRSTGRQAEPASTPQGPGPPWRSIN